VNAEHTSILMLQSETSFSATTLPEATDVCCQDTKKVAVHVTSSAVLCPEVQLAMMNISSHLQLSSNRRETVGYLRNLVPLRQTHYGIWF
jgi:hypothetical protein